MEQRHKQRLVGAIVIFALAVIFLPMILRGPVEDRSFGMPAQIPPRPSAPLSGEPVQPEVEAGAPAVDRVPLRSAELDPPEVEEPRETVEPGPDAEPEPERETESAESPPAVDPDSRAASIEGFAVQVGSFSRRDNAVALRDQLRENGYSAFVDEVQRDQGSLFRLRVGPVMNRDEARELAERLQQGEGLEGMVVSHP